MMKHRILKFIFAAVVALFVGFVMGGYVFRDVQPRSFLALDKCNDHCLKANDLLGLLTAAVIQNVSGVIPSVVLETDKTIAIRHPMPQSPVHFVVFPKRDIKNLGEISSEDQEYLMDSLNVLSQLIRENNLKNYKIVTNGPENQITTYLHFHLRAE